MTRTLDEREVLTACALRFDGWAYLEATGFDAVGLLDRFFATGEWPGSTDERLASFDLLQRDLCKWALVYEPPHGRYWRAFRALFLTVYDAPIPEAYRPGRYFEEWEREYRPRIDECVALVRKIHATIPYNDEAGPDIGPSPSAQHLL